MNSRILIFDDSLELLEALDIFLEQESFEVSTASNKKMFQSALENFEPDIIVLDVYLSQGVNGREICLDIKSDTKTNISR